MDAHCSAAPHLLNNDHHNFLKLPFCCCCEQLAHGGYPKIPSDHVIEALKRITAVWEQRELLHVTRDPSPEKPDTRYQIPDARQQTPDPRHQIPDVADHNHRRALRGEKAQLPLIRTAATFDGDPTGGSTSIWSSAILDHTDDVAKDGHGP
jgi:hypothetical protein